MINRKPKISNILASSMMVKRRAIIVEGTDDIKKYENILENSTNLGRKGLHGTLKVYAVENILDPNEQYYVEGCVGVIQATKDLKINSNNNINDLKKYILGFIDKDVRNHRQDIEQYPDFDILYMLNLNSIETFYVNKFSIKPLIKELISGTGSLMSDNLLEYIYNEALGKTINNLFYPVLDSFKKSIDSTYSNAKYGYDKEYGYIKHNINLLIEEEKELLRDEFSQMKEELSTYLDICKGKWFFECWLEHAIDIIVNLKQKCGTEVLEQCDFCANHKPNKCSYKSTVSSSNIHATYAQKIFNEQPFLDQSLHFNTIINRFDLMFT